MIEKEEDGGELQKNLDMLYKWEQTIKMKLKEEKFQLLRYGPDEDLKTDTIYNLLETWKKLSSNYLPLGT